MDDWRHGGFGLYLHWPFCQSKCPYCDFNSHVALTIDERRWTRAYLTEIDRVAAQTSDRVLQTVFFGGGTPSLMAPEMVGAILDRIRAAWPMVNEPEITLEANPGSVEVGRFRAYRAAGVNRVSMGIQALNDADLKRLGRLHSVAEARAGFDVAQGAFERASFDLIYARQDQTLADWRAELRLALSLSGDHLSLYQLTIEPGTAFGDRFARGGLLGLPGEDLAADLYDVTQEECSRAGMTAYEVSNHAAAGSESRHNLIYWRGGDYLGIGPGAHGRVTLDGTRWATECPKAPDAWLRAVESQGSGILPATPLSGGERATEYLMMGLRLEEGISLTRHRAMAGCCLAEDKLIALQDLDLLHRSGDRLRATPAGRMVLNAILRDLI